MASANAEKSSAATASSFPIPSLKDRIPKLEPRRRRQPPSNPISVPSTPELPSPPDLANVEFQTPTRRIISKADLDVFLSSAAYRLVLAFVFRLSESVAETPCSAVRDTDLSTSTTAILQILQEATDLVQSVPPDDTAGSRFGNKAFRGFLSLAEERAPEWHKRLGVISPEAASEVTVYLLHSFGDGSRIDYGSGHELNFIVWLLCLFQLRIVGEGDFKVLVVRVFGQYLRVMRQIQLTYYLEPAGSHGVWGLDDYQFLPFLFGSSQLLHHRFITPMAIHQELTIEEFSDEYLYLDQVRFVNSTKTVKGLRWHSPMLDDISTAKSWTKVEEGMRRMFVAEVLGKLPVMQHFLFGSLIRAEEDMSPAGSTAGSGTDAGSAAGESAEDGHVHQGIGWGDCCGIKVPSSIAAAQELRKKQGGEALRRIPFD